MNINQYSPKQLAGMEKALEVARYDLISFGKLFLKGDFAKSETPDFHREIARAYLAEDITKQLAIIIARGHAKTTLTKAFILHRFLFHKQGSPPLFYGWVADSLGKSFRNVEYISQQIMYNDRIKTYFGDQCGKHYNKKWTEQDIVLANDCTLISRSNARSLRGETKGSVIGGSQRYNVIILDDIENEENTLTLESRTKIKRTVTNAVYPALDIHNGRLIFNGTPVHYDSLCQNILDGWKKAIHDGTEDEYSYNVITYKASQPTMPGGVLWESYIPREELDKRKQFYIDNNNLPGYYQEYELEPQGNEHRIWTRDHYIIHDASYMWNEQEKQSYLTWKNETFPVNCFWGSDPATDIETRTSDNSVIMVIAEDALKRIFVLEYEEHLAIPQMGLRDATGKLVNKKGVVDYIFELNDKYHCKNGTVEDVGITRGIIQDIEAEKFRLHRYDLIANPTEPGGQQKINKVKTGLNTMFSYRLVHYRDNHYTLREQTENFGPKMKHDDVIETLLFATLNMYPPEYGKKKINVWNRLPKIKPKDWKVA